MRRRLIYALGVAGIAVIIGCGGEGGDGSFSTNGSSGSTSSTDGSTSGSSGTAGRVVAGSYSVNVTGSDTASGTYSGTGTLTIDGSGVFTLNYGSNRALGSLTFTESNETAGTVSEAGTFAGTVNITPATISRSITGTMRTFTSGLPTFTVSYTRVGSPNYTVTQVLTLSAD